jgi:hypothetical protein
MAQNLVDASVVLFYPKSVLWPSIGIYKTEDPWFNNR